MEGIPCAQVVCEIGVVKVVDTSIEFVEGRHGDAVVVVCHGGIDQWYSTKVTVITYYSEWPEYGMKVSEGSQ